MARTGASNTETEVAVMEKGVKSENNSGSWRSLHCRTRISKML